MSGEHLVLVAIAVIAASGIPGLFFGRGSAGGQRLAVVFFVAGAAIGMAGVRAVVCGGKHQAIALEWAVPGGEFAVAVDGISVVFLAPIFLVPTLGSIYGLGYWRQCDHPDNGRKLRLFYGLVTAGLALVVIARNAVLFLAAWEVMALAAFFLVTTEDRNERVREVGWIYLIATHTATLCLFAMFGLLHRVTGSLALAPVAAGAASPAQAAAIFLLALAGFGLKAGVMPLHVWLPGAHAMAPSHVSALLSGVLIKVGIYGLVRVSSFFPAPPVWWGGLVLVLGVASGVLGVAFAIGQHDLKRLLAYHSVENIGIIAMGLGLALIGRAMARTEWLFLGLAGALLHVWNHALFKSLLFFSAGSVVHGVGTREMDRMGGLARRMPRTAFCFLVGAVAICGLPPLNGFVSELLIYLGLFRTLGIGGGRSLWAAAVAAPALALIGALALACFVKAYGVVFLGQPRTRNADDAHESGLSMIGPMVLLVACCSIIGLAPVLVTPVFDQAVRAWAPELAGSVATVARLAPLRATTVLGASLVGATAVVALGLQWSIRRASVASAGTWDCGYAAPSPAMQYTSSSFAEMLVGLFRWFLRPSLRVMRARGIFPSAGQFESHVPDIVLDGALRPSFRFFAWGFSWFRLLQQGSIQAYLFYIFVMVIVLVLWGGAL